MKLEIKGMSYRYPGDGRKVIQKFCLEMEDTEQVGIMAPSGYGKTTLCKLIAGYLEPQEGEILLDGKSLESYKGYCPVQMIWQHPELAVDPKMRMKEILEEGDEVEERIQRELGIEDGWMNRFPAELSGGELQRFCIARALGRRTRFLLADETTTMLDLITQSQLWDFLIREVKQRKIGLIAVSHDESLLERICSRILRLD